MVQQLKIDADRWFMLKAQLGIFGGEDPGPVPRRRKRTQQPKQRRKPAGTRTAAPSAPGQRLASQVSMFGPAAASPSPSSAAPPSPTPAAPDHVVHQHRRRGKSGTVSTVARHRRKSRGRMSREDRGAALRAARSAYYSKSATADQVAAALDGLPPNGRKADKLRPLLEAKLATLRPGGDAVRAVAPGAGGGLSPAPKKKARPKKKAAPKGLNLAPPDALYPHPERLARTLRQRSEKLLAAGERDYHFDSMENTSRRAVMADNRRAKARTKIEMAKRMRRMVQLIEGGYQPTNFEALMFQGRTAEIGRLVYIRDLNGYSQHNVGGHFNLSWFESEYDLGKLTPGKRRKLVAISKRYKRLLSRYTKPGETHGRVPITPELTEKIVKLHREYRKAGGRWTWSDDRIDLNMKAHMSMGYTSNRQTPEILEKYKAWRELTNPGQVVQERSEIPDRSRARDPFEERLARAEQDEKRRRIPQQFRRVPGFFETPHPVSERLIEYAEIEPGMTVLEPSAGRGGLADRLPDDVTITVAERSVGLQGELRRKGYDPQPDAYGVQGYFDRVVMNPPFEKGEDAKQVRHAFENNLKPGGTLAAIVSAGPFFRSDRASQAFREWLDLHDHHVEDIPPAAWKNSNTAVNAKIIVIHKPHRPEQVARLSKAVDSVTERWLALLKGQLGLFGGEGEVKQHRRRSRGGTVSTVHKHRRVVARRKKAAPAEPPHQKNPRGWDREHFESAPHGRLVWADGHFYAPTGRDKDSGKITGWSRYSSHEDAALSQASEADRVRQRGRYGARSHAHEHDIHPHELHRRVQAAGAGMVAQRQV